MYMAQRLALLQRCWVSTCASMRQRHSSLEKLQDLAKHLTEDAQSETDLPLKKTKDIVSEPAARAQTLPTFPVNLASDAEIEAEAETEAITKPVDSQGHGEAKQKTTNSVRRIKWTLDEKKRLLRIVDKYKSSQLGSTWSDVAKHFPGRSLCGCRDAYRRILRRNNIHSVHEDTTSWSDIAVEDRKGSRYLLSEEERDLLERLVHKHGDQSWTAIADEMSAITGKPRERGVYRVIWCFRLCPKAQNAPKWDSSKAEKLRKLAREHGKDEVFLTYKFFPEYTPSIISYMLRRMDSKNAGKDYRPLSFWKQKKAKEKGASLGNKQANKQTKQKETQVIGATGS